jgi:hypothetical protein
MVINKRRLIEKTKHQVLVIIRIVIILSLIKIISITINHIIKKNNLTMDKVKRHLLKSIIRLEEEVILLLVDISY